MSYFHTYHKSFFILELKKGVRIRVSLLFDLSFLTDLLLWKLIFIEPVSDWCFESE